MIELILFQKDYRGFKAKDLIVFHEGVNLLVGDQGAGKSSLLGIIVDTAGLSHKAFVRRALRGAKDVALLHRTGEPRRIFAYDYEGDNPRIAAAFDMMGMIEMSAGISAMYGSHGEFTRGLNNVLNSVRDHYVILDEPDSGLSPRSALLLAESMKSAATRNCQVIAAVHNPWVIEAFPRVYDVTKKALVDSAAYLAEQRRSAAATAAPPEPETPPQPEPPAPKKRTRRKKEP